MRHEHSNRCYRNSAQRPSSAYAPGGLELKAPLRRDNVEIDKIVIPLDGSPVGNSAVDYIVGRKFELMHAQIHLLNVQPPLNIGKIAQVLAPDEIAAMRLAAGLDVLRPARETLQANGMLSTASVVVGRVAEAIVRYAAAHDCTSIVIGTKAMGPLKTFIQGSVPTIVVHRTTVPVTLVKQASGSSMVSTAPYRFEPDHADAELHGSVDSCRAADRIDTNRTTRDRAGGRATAVDEAGAEQ